MSLKKRGEIYHVDIEVAGQPRIRKSTGTKDRKLAQKIHDQLKADAYKKQKSGKTLSDALVIWLKASERRKNEKNMIRNFLKLYPCRPLHEIDGHDILDSHSHYKASTYNRTANIIRSAINMATARGWCDPIKIYRRKEGKVDFRFLTREEWARLQKELPEHLLAPATFALYTGLRQANVLGLTWQNVDIESEMAWVQPTESKSGNAIGVPLNKKALEAVKSQIGNHEVYVFTYKGRQFKGIKSAWSKALKRAGIENFRWHDFRHTFASWHVMAGTPLRDLKELGGWSDYNMVLRYAHLAPNHLKSASENI